MCPSKLVDCGRDVRMLKVKINSMVCLDTLLLMVTV